MNIFICHLKILHNNSVYIIINNRRNDMIELAKNVVRGYERGEASLKNMELDQATIQRLYRQIKTEFYRGTIAGFICNKIASEVLYEIRKGLDYADKMGLEYPPTEEILNRIVFENDKDTLYCTLLSMMENTLRQSFNKKDKKLLDIAYYLYYKNLP